MYLVFAKDLSNSHPSNGLVGSNIFLSEVCGVGMQVSVFPSVRLVLGIKPRWVALVAHAFAIVGFCSLSVVSSVMTYSYTEIWPYLLGQ